MQYWGRIKEHPQITHPNLLKLNFLLAGRIARFQLKCKIIDDQALRADLLRRLNRLIDNRMLSRSRDIALPRTAISSFS